MDVAAPGACLTMACPPIFGTRHFLADIIVHVDCTAASIGSNGFGALARPESAPALAVASLLTIFVALFGIRLLLGSSIGGRDMVGAILKIGIVLTLATSWPAWRVTGYGLVIHAPIELATSIGSASGVPGSRGDLISRLDRADEAIVGLTAFGSGRLTGGQSAGPDLGNSFQGVALSDQSALGLGRLAFLTGTLAPLIIVKVSAGILLALAPLMAGLLLFDQTSALFFGWLRGLAACALCAMALALVYGVELSVIEPWLSNVLAQRQGHFLAPSSPTELLVLTLSFALVAFGVLTLFARISFFSQFKPAMMQVAQRYREMLSPRTTAAAEIGVRAAERPSRAFVLAQSVEDTVRREEVLERRGWIGHMRDGNPTGRTEASANGVQSQSLGTSYRRTYRRATSASGRRDRLT